MIKKEDLSQQIAKAIALGNNLIPLLNRHVSASLSFSHLKANDCKKIQEHFQIMALQQKMHLEILQDMKKELNHRNAHVF